MSYPPPGPADSSGWKHPVAHTKNGDSSHPGPTPLLEGVRALSPDPYADGSPHVRRNFSRNPGKKED